MLVDSIFVPTTPELKKSILEAELKSTNCPLCEHSGHRVFLEAPNRFRPENGYHFNIVRCKGCGFVFLNPRPTKEKIVQYYQESGYDPFSSVQSKQTLWNFYYDLVRKFALSSKRKGIEELRTSGRLLDVGCGTGQFLNEMQQGGWEVAGMEKDPSAADFGSQKYGLNIDTRELEDCDFESDSFDVITMWHVIEHVFSPVQTLKTIRNLLKPDGILLLAMPNVESFDSRFYKENWVALDTPRHLSHFTPNSIEEASRRVGLEIQTIKQMPLDAFYNCFLSEQLLLSLKKRSKLFLPFSTLRAVSVALRTILTATSGQVVNGSSNLYFLTKNGN